MTKKEIAKELVDDELVASQSKAEAIVNSVFNTIAERIKDGDDVSIHKFGIFKSQIQTARTAKNPATGKDVKVPEKRVMKFKVSSAIKQYLNN